VEVVYAWWMLIKRSIAVLALSFVACSESDSPGNSAGNTDTGGSPVLDMGDPVPDGGMNDADMGAPEDMKADDAGMESFELVAATPDPSNPLMAETTVTFRLEFSMDIEDAAAFVGISQVRPGGQSGDGQFVTPDGSMLETEPVILRPGTTRVDITLQGLRSASGEMLVAGGLLEDELLTLSYPVLNMGMGGG